MYTCTLQVIGLPTYVIYCSIYAFYRCHLSVGKLTYLSPQLYLLVWYTSIAGSWAHIGREVLFARLISEDNCYLFGSSTEEQGINSAPGLHPLLALWQARGSLGTGLRLSPRCSLSSLPCSTLNSLPFIFIPSGNLWGFSPWLRSHDWGASPA